MAIFSGKTKTEEVAAHTAASSAGDASVVIIEPRVTEKSHSASEEKGVYIFEVRPGVSKGKVAQAVKELYKVTPLKVSLVPIVRKSRFVKGRVAYTKGGRKAYVYLKKGEKIEFAK